MVLSHFFGKRRLAANVRPSFWDAWLLVVADVAIILTLLFLITWPLMVLIYASQPSDQATGLFLFVLYILVPIGILTNGCIWAYRSRKRY